MTEVTEVRQEFDLQPDPRILRMLGEINLPQWRCLAELVDNSIDGFLNSRRNGVAIEGAEIHVSLPSVDSETAHVEIRDNGPGMSPETLQQAVRAGWSGNDPVSSLGMFGMGFNIATARLGTVTTVWTTRRGDDEWHGLRIDFDELQRQRHFRTPRISRPKIARDEHGTEVRIERLKLDQRKWMIKASNQSGVRRELKATYSSMLRHNGVPISFSLSVNGTPLTGRQHCVWDEQRFVESSRYGPIRAVQQIDVPMGDRLYCLRCWGWLPANESLCPACGAAGNVISRRRHVHGWIGLQRYLDNSEYGIDFVRNGRKIELASKDLFVWRGSEGEEPEYPIDDPRNRGRIVGEIHIDHCRVTYTKDRFERSDPAWEEMLRVVRGEGPLRPERAKELGYGPNTSPLFLLFQAFRRSTPKPRVAGCWERLLIVSDNDRAEQMAKHFHAQVPEYQDDTKWWELIQEQERAELLGKGGTPPTGDGPDVLGFGEPEPGAPPILPPQATPTAAPPPAPKRIAIPSLTRDLSHDASGQKWSIRALAVESDDAALGGVNVPWRLSRLTAGGWEFYVNERHDVFRSATMTPLDALLGELAASAVDFLRGSPIGGVTFATILADLRAKYAGSTKLDPVSLSAEARLTLAAIARSLNHHIDEEDGQALFAELLPSDQDAVMHKMATRGAGNPQQAIKQGRFLEFAANRVLEEFFLRHPELFFDGKYWDVAYSSLDYGRASANEEARTRVVQYFRGLISDAAWLAEQDPTDLALASRPRLLRAALALDLLAPDKEIDEASA